MPFLNDDQNQNKRLDQMQQQITQTGNNVAANAQAAAAWWQYLNKTIPAITAAVNQQAQQIADLNQRLRAAEAMNASQDAALQGLKQVGQAISQAEAASK